MDRGNNIYEGIYIDNFHHCHIIIIILPKNGSLVAIDKAIISENCFDSQKIPVNPLGREKLVDLTIAPIKTQVSHSHPNPMLFNILTLIQCYQITHV